MEYRKIPWGKRQKLSKIEDYNQSSVIVPAKTIFLVNGEIHKLIKYDKRKGMVVLFNVVSEKSVYMLYADFLRKAEKLYPRSRVAPLVNRKLITLESLESSGLVPEYHKYYRKDGHIFRKYLTMEQIKVLRDMMLENKRGNAVPTDAELTRKAGEGMMLYTTTPEGKMIPVWGESL